MAVEFLLVFIPMFIIIDPFSVLPLFITLTGSMNRTARMKTLRYSILFATSLLIVFSVLGKAILDYLSISIDALRITGGLLLLVIGISMLYEGDPPRSRRKGEEEVEEKQLPEDMAFVPLGTPMLAGPGAMSVVIILSGTSEIPLVIASLITVMLVSTLILVRADLIFKLIGKAGTRALTRVMGLLASAYAVQMILDGVSDYAGTLG
ncbi:MAG: MarC family protein [Thermoplasmatota archaeon]|nr:MarC family protein [Candidatus Thermoplasmatota archaeon]MBU1915400.1 MarC family protein [Candidatus Thermoplasmatota archaeon]